MADAAGTTLKPETLAALFLLAAGCTFSGLELSDRAPEGARELPKNNLPTLEAKQGASAACPSSPAPKLFSRALCLCGDFDQVGELNVRAAPSGAVGSVGVNGNTSLTGNPTVEGSWIAYRGLGGVGNLATTGNVETTGEVSGTGELRVGGDLVVGGDLSGVGQLSVAGKLRVAGKQSLVGNQQVGGLGPYTAPALPCGCEASQRFDVAGAVAEAKTRNDNAAAQLPTVDVVGQYNLKLSSGRYYFESVRTLGDSLWQIDGSVAVFIDGNLDQVGDANIDVAPGATLDLYVSGSIHTVGSTRLAARPGAVRLYVGGKAPMLVSVGDLSLVADLYAPEAEVSLVGDARVDGALFAHTLESVGSLALTYAPPAPPADSCSTSPDGGTAPGQGQGAPSDGGVIIN